MTVALQYENFIRDAFSLSSQTQIGRYGDPARLATTDNLHEQSLDSAKAAIAYSMEIFREYISDSKGGIAGLGEAEYYRISQFTSSVIRCRSCSDLSALISEFCTTVVTRYLERAENGIYE